MRSSRRRATCQHKRKCDGEEGTRTDGSSITAHRDQVIAEVRNLPGHLVNLVLAVEDILDCVPSVVISFHSLVDSRCRGRDGDHHRVERCK